MKQAAGGGKIIGSCKKSKERGKRKEMKGTASGRYKGPMGRTGGMHSCVWVAVGEEGWRRGDGEA
jgi:hypothetical protein